jgi:peptidoglycan/LPS O-acetylase OafA/YrhL
MRGLAVLAVVLYHTGGLLPGGYVGVDVFFVLSGYVISRLLLTEFAATGSCSFRTFYLRRSRRLLPALGLLLASVALLAPLLAPGDAAQASGTAIAAALFSANIFLFTQDGYFATAAELNPLLHTWSLSVEEQFYFVLPALLFLAWRIGARRWRSVPALRVFVAAAFALSLATSLLFSYAGSVGPLPGQRLAFFSPMTRTWEFVAGVALALVPGVWFEHRSVRRVAVLAGLGLIVASTLVLSEETVFPGTAALVPVVGTALVLYGGTVPHLGVGTARPGPRLARPLTWLGDTSYSWYLWHWPVIVFAAAFWPNVRWVPVAAALVSLLPAWASFRWLEQRFRGAGSVSLRYGSTLAVVSVAIPIAAVALAQPLSAFVSNQGDVAAFAAARQFHEDLLAGCDDSTPLGSRPEGRCRWGSGDAGEVVLIGDSQAGQFSEALIGATDRLGAQLLIATTSACPFIDAVYEARTRDSEACRAFVDGSLRALEADPPDVVVIGITDGYHLDDGATLTDLRSGEVSGDPARRGAIFQEALERNVRRLEAAGVEVVLLGTVPRPVGWDSYRCSSLAVLVDVDRCAFTPFTLAEAPGLARANGFLQGAAAASGAELWDLNLDLCPAGACRTLLGGAVLWRDSGHISVSASERLAEPVATRLRPLVDA